MKWKDFAENLYLHEALHFVSGLEAAVFIYFIYHSVPLSSVAFIVSFAIDSDHYFESLFYFKFNLIKIIKNRYNCWIQTNKMTILFHSWELVFISLFLGLKFNFVPLATAISLSLAVHLLVDTLVYSFCYQMPFYQYFLIYRAIRRFNFLMLYNEGKEDKVTLEEIYEKYGKR